MATVMQYSADPAKVAQINDKFRRVISLMGRMSYGCMMVTPGIKAIETKYALLDAIGKFKDFTEDNDPYGEHDFISLIWEGHKVYAKIDYYNKEMDAWCDPLSQDCYRVMTVMLASEY